MYNFETNTVEEWIHIKFDDKESDNKKSEKVESFIEIRISKDVSEPVQASRQASEASEPGGASNELEADVPFEANPYDEDFEASHDGSERHSKTSLHI